MITFINSEPLSPEAVDQFERRVGHKLPPDYRAFLLEHNGGIPSYKIFRDCYVQFMFIVNHPKNDPLGSFPETLPDWIIPFALEGRGDYFLIDLRSGQVLHWDHNFEDDNVTVVATSVGEFLRELAK